jgi:hypothetical protein
VWYLAQTVLGCDDPGVSGAGLSSSPRAMALSVSGVVAVGALIARAVRADSEAPHASPWLTVADATRLRCCVSCPMTYFGRWIQIEGTVQIVSLPEAMEGLVDYYRGISGEHPDWVDHRCAMQPEQRELVRVSIDVAGPAQGR